MHLQKEVVPSSSFTKTLMHLWFLSACSEGKDKATGFDQRVNLVMISFLNYWTIKNACDVWTIEFTVFSVKLTELAKAVKMSDVCKIVQAIFGSSTYNYL